MIGAVDRNSNKLTLAGLLMFGHNIDIIKIKPSFFLDYREIDDLISTERWSNRITSSPDEMVTGNLWGFFSKIVNRLTADIPIVIEKGPDYFKFSNPGNSRIPIDIAMKGGRSDPRNVILHQMFSYLGYGERAGSGLYMISTVWKDKNWIRPEMEDELNPNRTILTLYMRKNNNYPNNLTKIQIKILEIIKLNPTISVKQISELINEIKYDAVRWNITELKKKKVIERTGTTRKGTWIIL